MRNQEHLETLNKGVEAWNRWRYENPSITGFEGGGGDAGLRATARGLLLYGADAPGKRIGLRPEFAMRFPDDVGVRQLQSEVSMW